MIHGHDVRLFVTDLFFANGADFNKYAALEAALDHFGREGFITLLDADIVYPEGVSLEPVFGKLSTPHRRLYPEVTRIPPESEWPRLPVHRNASEWAGYSQTFHAEDPAMGPPPWHWTDVRHAGVADSIFQRKWQQSDKIRPAWKCLHLGPCGANWCGRATAYADGTSPKDADVKTAKLRGYFAKRHLQKNFAHERLA